MPSGTPSRHFIGDERAIDIARENEIDRHTFQQRLRYGWSVIDAATTPTGKKMSTSQETDHEYKGVNMTDELQPYINKLKKKYRVVLTYAYQDKLTNQQIAAKYNVSTKLITKIKKDALVDLKKWLNKPTIEEFIEQYQGRVGYGCYYELTKYGKLLSHIDIDDLKQDAWLTIIRNYPKYDPTRSKIKTWIINITRTHGLMNARTTLSKNDLLREPCACGHKRSRHMKDHNCKDCPCRKYDPECKGMMAHIVPMDSNPHSDGVSIEELLPSNGEHDSQKIMEKQEAAKQIMECMDLLKPKYSKILRWIFFDNRTVVSIANELSATTGLKITSNYVFKIKRRGITLLKKEFLLANRKKLSKIPAYHMNNNISVLHLSTTTGNLLEKEGITSLGGLCCKTEEDILKIPNFGLKGLMEVRQVLKSSGLRLGVK